MVFYRSSDLKPWEFLVGRLLLDYIWISVFGMGFCFVKWLGQPKKDSKIVLDEIELEKSGIWEVDFDQYRELKTVQEVPRDFVLQQAAEPVNVFFEDITFLVEENPVRVLSWWETIDSWCY